jgi:hypothetical protein
MRASIRTVLAAGLVVLMLPGGARAESDEAAGGSPYDREFWRNNRIQLNLHPVGPVLPRGQIKASGLVPMYPAGFPADRFGFALRPTYGLGGGWEVGAGFLPAQRHGAGGNATFYGLALQKELLEERRGLPALSVGAYGMLGPHDHHSANFYLAATRRVYGNQHEGTAAWLSGGVKYELFGSDDYGSGSGVRPYGGLAVRLTPRVFIAGEISPRQPWQRATMWAARATYMVPFREKYHLGIEGGLRSTGYETHPFFSVVL